MKRPLVSREWILFIGVVAIWTCVWYATPKNQSNDGQAYLQLAEGLGRGHYSMWGALPDAPPDTFRTPGYPLFLLVVGRLGGFVAPETLQLTIVLLALWGMWRVTRSIGGVGAGIGFLLLSLVSIQIPYYAAALYPEALVASLLAMLVCCQLTMRERTFKSLSLGFLLGALIVVRPVYLLMAPVWPLLGGLRGQILLRRAPLVLSACGLVLAPYGAWNRIVHGSWSLTPIEGAAANAHLGFWQHRLPNQWSSHYWANTWMGEEAFPLVEAAAVQGYVDAYDAEWTAILGEAAPYLTDADRSRLTRMSSPGLFPTFSSQYTQARRKVIEQHLTKAVTEEPGYYVKTRAYAAIRFWVTAPNLRVLREHPFPQSPSAWYPTLLTASVFGLGIPFIAVALVRGRLRHRAVPVLLLPVLYSWAIHLPMSIQSRYSVPVHWMVFSLIGVAWTCRCESKRD